MLREKNLLMTGKKPRMIFKFLRLHLKFVDVVSKENKNLH
jgi:hypothetical protein